MDLKNLRVDDTVHKLPVIIIVSFFLSSVLRRETPDRISARSKCCIAIYARVSEKEARECSNINVQSVFEAEEWILK